MTDTIDWLIEDIDRNREFVSKEDFSTCTKELFKVSHLFLRSYTFRTSREGGKTDC